MYPAPAKATKAGIFRSSSPSPHTHSLSLSLSLSPLLLAAAPSPRNEMVGPTRREEEEGREKEQRGEGGIEAKDFKRRKGEGRQGKGKEAL